jgi:hypothetical protein
MKVDGTVMTIAISAGQAEGDGFGEGSPDRPPEGVDGAQYEYRRRAIPPGRSQYLFSVLFTVRRYRFPAP